jgi:hypothetical protein
MTVLSAPFLIYLTIVLAGIVLCAGIAITIANFRNDK